MDWLILFSDSDAAGRIRAVLGKKKSGVVVHDFSLSGDLSGAFGLLPQITHCVLLAEDAAECGADLSFVTGFLVGKGIPVYAAPCALPAHVSECGTVSAYKNAAALEKYIDSAFDEIDREFTVSDSRRYLFDVGMPFTPDCFALNIQKNQREICGRYLAGGIDINCRDGNGTPMLNIAARSERPEILEWLLENGADINAVSADRGYTAVMDAVWRGNKEIAGILIRRGADLDVLSKEGQTALVLAVGGDKKEICRMLAEGGADPDITDAMGMSAYGYAKLFKKDEIAGILEKYHKA